MHTPLDSPFMRHQQSLPESQHMQGQPKPAGSTPSSALSRVTGCLPEPQRGAVQMCSVGTCQSVSAPLPVPATTKVTVQGPYPPVRHSNPFLAEIEQQNKASEGPMAPMFNPYGTGSEFTPADNIRKFSAALSCAHLAPHSLTAAAGMSMSSPALVTAASQFEGLPDKAFLPSTDADASDCAAWCCNPGQGFGTEGLFAAAAGAAQQQFTSTMRRTSPLTRHSQCRPLTWMLAFLTYHTLRSRTRCLGGAVPPSLTSELSRTPTSCPSISLHLPPTLPGTRPRL